jgi:hypothetical protein
MIILQEILTEKYGSGQFTQLERGAVKLLYWLTRNEIEIKEIYSFHWIM